ncbi:FAD-dependent oxidoreductase [Rhodococcus wratislaviensis]|uniref:FAD-dependent oxidoreductase n=1 Tax=Rhodococcus wratislaviensis TaxID=44752 RepID=UPI003667A9DF
MPFVITQPCCNDATCVSVCPVNCIHPTPDEPGFGTSEMLYIDPDGCIDCGACVAPCPVDAIVSNFDLTEETERYAQINAQYYADPAHQDYSDTPYAPHKPSIEVSEQGPLRVAVVGSGPAGCYAAEELLTSAGTTVEVHLFERLPTPWGLVRYGVAPDHQGTKSVTDLFTRTARRPGLDFHLNVQVGEHITHEELLAHHHAVIYAVGAPHDRKLGIPGEDLPGSHSATDFVAWYNGHPDFTDRSFDLTSERAVIVGNGNVALDIARILTSDVDQLARTDIADHALEALSRSNITEVVVLGRRGPAQAAFTTPELLGLAAGNNFDVIVAPDDAQLDPVTAAKLAADPHSMTGLKSTIIAELASRPTTDARKRVTLRFLASPAEVLGENRVRGLRIVRNELVSSAGERLEAHATAVTEEIECGLVLKSVGYRGAPIPGLPFDDAHGTLPNDAGRVIDPSTKTPIPGVYTAGWMKRGPSGVIGTNKKCAGETVQALLSDFAAGRLEEPKLDGDALRELIIERQPHALDHTGWEAIDLYERTTAHEYQRPRIKLTDTTTMLNIAENTPPQNN